ncbi:pentapeptide repeat-containing protein [Actinosynnema sp. CA-248983]
MTWGRRPPVPRPAGTRFPRALHPEAARLDGADLRGADLRGADLRGADLRKVFGKTPAEVRAVAKTDENTRFGDETRPAPSQCGPRRPYEVELHAWPR